MFNQLKAFMQKPRLYEKGTAKLWNDEHISKGMLEAHLTPDWDSATRKHAFVRKSVDWISEVAPAGEYQFLMDLGCGPGIYAERFNEAGYRVTGLDFSERSIGYARGSAKEKNLSIDYVLCDYLSLDYAERFDLVTLINYDFGVLSTEDRVDLLSRIHTALKPNGRLIFDVFTPRQYEDRKEYQTWNYAEEDFFSAEPRLCLESLHRYDEANTFLTQYLLITDGDVKCLNIWEHTFTAKELEQDLKNAGFVIKGLYGDISGKEYIADGKEICVLAEKEDNNGII